MSIVEGLLIQSLSLLSGLTSRTFSRPYSDREPCQSRYSCSEAG